MSRIILYALGALCFASCANCLIDSLIPPVVVTDDPNTVKFFLYNDKTNQDVSQELIYGDLDSVLASSFNSSLPTKVTIHGFGSSPSSVLQQSLKNAYLNSGLSYNVIVVDWSLLAQPLIAKLYNFYYIAVAKNVPIAGVRVGEFLSWLNIAGLLNLDKVHLLGHSLGGHVIGNAGREVQSQTGKNVTRLTALDPAGPSFDPTNSNRLLPTDGQYVEAYHTNDGQLGNTNELAQVDFRMNGGCKQPGCGQADTSPNPLPGTGTISDAPGICSHRWSIYAFINTIGNSGQLRPQDTNLPASLSALAYALDVDETNVTLGEYVLTSRPPNGDYYVDYNFTYEFVR